MTEDVKILRIEGNISALSNGQMGVESGPDSDLDFTMWGGKDYAGHVTKFLAKDEKASISELTIPPLGGSGAGFLTVDDDGVAGFSTVAATAGTLQQTLDNGSTATIATDIEVSVVKDAPLSGINNPIYVRERIRNSGTLGATERAAQMRRRAEGQGGTSYSESNQTAMESNSARDFISDIAAVDTQTARIRCRVLNGVSTITENAQTKTVTLNGDQTVAVEKDVLEGAVTDTESVKNIGLGATTGDVSFAKKVIIVESDNDTAGGLGTAGRLTLTVEASNEAGYDGDSAFSIDAFDGAVEKRITSSGILGANTFHSIIAQSFLVNGEPQGVQFVTTVADTPHVMTIASAKKIIFEGSASNSPCELPAANSTATLSDGTVVTMRGRSFELVNASSEFIPVQNSGTASSLWDVLAPDESMIVTCTGTSTAAGTWKYQIYENKLANQTAFEDFLSAGGQVSGTSTSVGRVMVGTGSSHLIRNSMLYFVMGTDAGAGGYVNWQLFGYDLTGTPFKQGRAGMFRAALTVNELSDETNTYSLRAGTLDNNAGTAPTTGIYFETDADGDIVGITQVSSTVTTVTGGGKIKLQASGLFSDCAWIRNSTGNRVDFYVDKALIGTSITNIMSHTVGAMVGVQYDRSAGTTVNLQAGIDFAKFIKPRY